MDDHGGGADRVGERGFDGRRVPPSIVLAPYKHPTVRAVATELDPIFKAIVDRALAAR